MIEDQPHWDHRGKAEAVPLEEVLRFGADLIRQERDTPEAPLLGESDGVLQQSSSVALSAMLGMYDDVLHQHYQSTLCSTDGEEQIDHAQYEMVGAQHKNTPTIGLLQNQSQPMLLLVTVGSKVCFLAEKRYQQLNELRQVLDRCRLDPGFNGSGGSSHDEIIITILSA